ncbi:RT0821/Lpp0805 family surface protein [Thioalkalivibrio sp. HK1]|uniref:RT0821/Lpp0805 family surface protein n=1 Tax=Thioalkalivibrio sp. HK1 TaxID=1469245 RepID=UPI0004720E2A|nr:RT0821/Lpp0805 family surface protein [Thioalkalivibrio sp. HK1]
MFYRIFSRRRLIAVLAVSGIVSLSGCNMTQNETTGTLLGGVAGAVIGNQFGKGSGNTAATALGAVIGASIGREIGSSLDANSRRQADRATRQALDTARVGGRSITWENPNNTGGAAQGRVRVVRQGKDNRGMTCREYNHTVTIGNREEQAYGTACRDSNGDWKIVQSG